jgi:hypothetical protein
MSRGSTPCSCKRLALGIFVLTHKLIFLRARHPQHGPLLPMLGGVTAPRALKTLTFPWRSRREANVARLNSLTPKQWKTSGMQEERGAETMETLVKMFAGHDLNHFEQIERILTSRPKHRAQSSNSVQNQQIQSRTNRRCFGRRPRLIVRASVGARCDFSTASHPRKVLDSVRLAYTSRRTRTRIPSTKGPGLSPEPLWQ